MENVWRFKFSAVNVRRHCTVVWVIDTSRSQAKFLGHSPLLFAKFCRVVHRRLERQNLAKPFWMIWRFAHALRQRFSGVAQSSAESKLNISMLTFFAILLCFLEVLIKWRTVVWIFEKWTKPNQCFWGFSSSLWQHLSMSQKRLDRQKVAKLCQIFGALLLSCANSCWVGHSRLRRPKVSQIMPKFSTFLFFAPMLVDVAQPIGASKIYWSHINIFHLLIFFLPMLVGGTQASGVMKVGKSMTTFFRFAPTLCQCLLVVHKRPDPRKSGRSHSKCFDASPLI